MKTPMRLLPLLQADLIDDVVGQLQSGKEAEVYLVRAEGVIRCAKVYKEANHRTFKQKTQYTEGRKIRNSRKARAMEGNSKYGRKEREFEWQNTEVDTLYLLAAAGVQVPQPLAFYEGVLLLEMVADREGNPAPRLSDVSLTSEQSRAFFQVVIRQAVRMLCAGIVHGDLSEFNILLSHKGLVIIDLPQAVQATANNAFSIFERDLLQLAAFFGRAAPEIKKTNYAKEIWQLYRNGKLHPDTDLTGQFADSSKTANVGEVLAEIDEAREEALLKRRGPK
ncbi:MAG: serine protein kinase RIO [Proteobacteria bacterium]|nr:serine protein kinase RIO [Pseudomonadota bacterium]